jgi:hypothetical protein
MINVRSASPYAKIKPDSRGLVLGIHVFVSSSKQGVDGRDKPDHDGKERYIVSLKNRGN